MTVMGAMATGQLLVSWIIVTGCLTSARASYITCQEGSAQTSTHVVNYSVKRRHPSFTECQKDADRKSELMMPPGAPKEIMATLAGPNLILTWRTPDDGSVELLSGFLVEIYVVSLHFTTGPDVCYTVNIDETLRNKNKDPYDRNCPLPQDAIFSLNCSLTGHERGVLDVVYVTSLPMPTRDVKTTRLNMSYYVDGSHSDWATWSTCTESCKPETQTQNPACQLQSNVQQDSKTNTNVTLLAVIGASVICLATVVTTIVYRTYMSKKGEESSMTTSKEEHMTNTTLNTEELMKNNTQEYTDEEINEQKLTMSQQFTSNITNFQDKTTNNLDDENHFKYMQSKEQFEMEHTIFLPPESLSDFPICNQTISSSEELAQDKSNHYLSIPPQYTSTTSNYQREISPLIGDTNRTSFQCNSSLPPNYSSAVKTYHNQLSLPEKHAHTFIIPQFFKDFANEVNKEL